MELTPSNFLKSTEKKHQPSDHVIMKTPKKFLHPPQRSKYHRRSTPLPEKRFTHQHLAQLKFLLPEEIGIRKVLMPDQETRCMKYDLHLTLNSMARAKKRKRGSKHSCLKYHLISQLLEFLRDHPEGTEIPEEKLPEPFNQKRHDALLSISKPSSSRPPTQNFSGVAVELHTARASHIPPSFRNHFSRGGSDYELRKSLQNPLVSSHQEQLMPVLNPSNDGNSNSSTPLLPETLPCKLPAGQQKHKPLADIDTCPEQHEQATPIKFSGTPIKPSTPLLRTPKRSCSSVDKKVFDRQSCARSLRFDEPSRDVHIELHIDDSECSNINDILPKNLLQSLKEKEKQSVEMVKRKQMMKKLPKLFDRIYILFQNPKSSAIRKEALIHALTECHLDITDEIEVEEQLKLLQEIIPEWMIRKFSPSGNILYTINKALNPISLRLKLDRAV
ncbi:CDT1-like protein a, chloroplastic isoform X2 [Amaranthus tricolor]|uniref:CDT1-like protein a, chloroplastic isoform X2 n=1 Tax=Amaranthus tricolor TaxID=29722 RepID=UPI00258EA6A5|nr:CDT1-like protein a, chloroplastic isoform X2 [Amaranthus tricolor]